MEIVLYKRTVRLPPRCSLEYALIELLTIYYVLNLSYPHYFGQTLGLVQTVLHESERFDRCLMSFKLKMILKQLQPMQKKTRSEKTGSGHIAYNLTVRLQGY
ncbi:unnamed protein product, partial [Ixodes persulcatus]